MKNIILLISLFAISFSLSQNYDQLIKEGRSLLGQKKYDEAILKFKEAEKIDSKKIEAKYGIAISLSQKYWHTKNKSDADKALEALKVVEKIDDKFANLNYNLSIVYFEMAKYDVALKHIDKQLEIGDKNDGDLYYQKGLVLVKQKKSKDACKLFKKADKLGANMAPQALKDYCK